MALGDSYCPHCKSKRLRINAPYFHCENCGASGNEENILVEVDPDWRAKMFDGRSVDDIFDNPHTGE